VADEEREQPRPRVQAAQFLDQGQPRHPVADAHKTSLKLRGSFLVGWGPAEFRQASSERRQFGRTLDQVAPLPAARVLRAFSSIRGGRPHRGPHPTASGDEPAGPSRRGGLIRAMRPRSAGRSHEAHAGTRPIRDSGGLRRTRLPARRAGPPGRGDAERASASEVSEQIPTRLV
jgi:hypothetical protein